ncbi:hypothetical protein LJC42_08075 [Eubacteriales bacterium OttesenSCG-928-K08]|nr:hypothetical protein [Eubacteriales bacterium OttesenSCG-928-K08]
MQTIVLIMRRKPVAQAFIKGLMENFAGPIIHEADYSLASFVVLENNASAALIEIGETSGYDAAHCISLCELLRNSAPSCKLFLMCPEQNESGVLEVVRAKKDGKIDDFVFYDTTLDYTISKLLSML